MITIICDDCGKTFPSTSAVLAHECAGAKPPENPAPILKRPHTCEACRKHFKSARALAVHVARAHRASAEVAE